MLKKKILFYSAIIWTILVTVLSLVSLHGIGQSIPVAGKDKIVHFTFYCCFVILWLSYFQKRKFDIKNEWKVVLVAIGYGILMEILQGTITTSRSADVFDAIANSIGAFSGLFIIRSFLKK